MRTPAAVAAVLAVTGAALTWAPTASAATECATNPLGTAGRYAEFVEQDSTRYSDSEGAVAVGGDAYFGDAKTHHGFSIGSRLTAADLAALPGGHSLVVGGTLHANQVVLDKGTGVAARVVDRSTPGAGFGVDGDKVKEGPSPIDFGKEFGSLRALSTGWAATRANGTVSASGDGIFLAGTDKRLNVFAVNAADLEKARAITLDVPVGASTLVNVLGSSYDMNASATYGVYYKNLDGGAPVVDDYHVPSDAYRQIRAKLLWNFPQATSVKKNYTSWPGTLLAPHATVAMGGPNVGPGHVNGSVIARKLVTVPGAETHQMNFTGCLPGGTEPGPIPTPDKPTPTDTPVPTAPATPSATPTPTGSGSPEPSSPATSAPTPSQSTSAAAPVPTPSSTPEGDLARTGSSLGPAAFGVAAGVLVLGGGLVAFAKLRRRAS
ncbi:choice-of-anchor A family protein [Streptomyces roseicoloratus]|uniref:choice-of-anchor A family protein n=1 Tax=Streptomyces roseicoloratus TaxID=2508722 RepID=UPI001009F366|nr:choice-of-anchor A family protein [Streptomyces roseicoloratus]